MAKFFVDVEASSPSPMTGKMTELGIVEWETGQTLYLKLYDFVPTPGNPALPMVLTPDHPSPEIRINDVRSVEIETVEQATIAVEDFLNAFGKGRHILISDNPAFDAMWVTCHWDSLGRKSPFGFSARRIGDFAAGLSGNFSNSSSWKKLRKTPHTHNPVDDAQGNREALLELVRRTA